MNRLIDAYIDSCPVEIQLILKKVRETIRLAAPDAIEKISWNMPTYYQNGNLVHFFAHKNHLGFYPTDSGIKHFSKEFEKLGFKFSKGAVQFPFTKEIPYNLISRITKFRVEENLKK